MLTQTYKEFGRLFDIYYWKTAALISSNQLARQYRNSFLGMIWTLLQPATMVLVYSVIMPLIMRFPQKDYVLFIIASLPLWTFISGSLVSASGAIIQQAETLKRCMISSTVFPVADVLKQAYTYGISFTTMYVIAAIFFFGFDPVVLLIPFYFLPVLVIIMAVGIAVAFIAPYLRDIGELIMMGMNMLFWLTPIIYPITVLPERVQVWMQWNPLYIMMHPIQKLAYQHTVPDITETVRLLGVMLLAIGVSYLFYRKCRRNYVYYL